MVRFLSLLCTTCYTSSVFFVALWSSTACCKQFRDEGNIPDLVLLADGKLAGEIVSEDIAQLAKKILDKIALEGGKNVLQLLLNHLFTVGIFLEMNCFFSSTVPTSRSV